MKNKRELLKYGIQLLIAILTAIGTSIGVSSCMRFCIINLQGSPVII